MNIKINKTLCPMQSFQFCECVLAYMVAFDKYCFFYIAFCLSFIIFRFAYCIDSCVGVCFVYNQLYIDFPSSEFPVTKTKSMTQS